MNAALLLLFVLTLNPLGAWAESQFDTCVNALHKNGGLSIRESQELCLQKPSARILECQNNLFHIAFLDPQTSYENCIQNNDADIFFKGEAYRGTFENLPSGNKKTVCSITVNSTEERDSFRKILPANQYDFVELLPTREYNRFISRDSYWLERSCESQVRCDVLVFSGHFADSFIGDAGFEVSMAELKKYKAQAPCQNFFDSIQEVYLFGCNTMASKKPDHRSIDQYIRVLIEDGIAPHTAQRIAARRYTPYDHSVAEKMSEIFSQASFIAGFPSTGPTGARIQKTLDKYVSSMHLDSTPAERVESFQKTLGQRGMIYSLPRKSTKSPAPVTLLTQKELLNFVQKYGSALPVATVDLLTTGAEQNILNSQGLDALKDDLRIRWLSMSPKSQLTQLCPLLLTDHADWLPSTLDCKNNTSWLK